MDYICNTCGEFKPEDAYYKHKRRDGYYRVKNCKDCHNAEARRRHAAQPDKYYGIRWRSKIKQKYGLTEDQFYKLLYDQYECCRICGNYMETPYIDHNHSTMEVRGLLCRDCNIGLGGFKDNIEYLKKAIEYLS